MMKMTVVFLLVAIGLGNVFAQDANEGATGMAFLKVGVDARAAGMGEAVTAVANNANAAFWNPAGILGAERSNLQLTHNAWLLDVDGQAGAVVFKRQKSAIGLHVQTMGVAGIPVRDLPTDVPLDETSATYSAMGITYARPFGERLEAGLNLRYLFEKIFVYTARGYAADLGLRYHFNPQITVAAALQHLGSMNELRSAATKLPTTFRAGGAYQPAAAFGPATVLLAADLVYPLEENPRVHLGGEAAFHETLMLRLGYATGYEARGLSFGVGIRKTVFRFDYSYSPFDSDLGESQRFTVYLGI